MHINVHNNIFLALNIKRRNICIMMWHFVWFYRSHSISIKAYVLVNCLHVPCRKIQDIRYQIKQECEHGRRGKMDSSFHSSKMFVKVAQEAKMFPQIVVIFNVCQRMCYESIYH